MLHADSLCYALPPGYAMTHTDWATDVPYAVLLLAGTDRAACAQPLGLIPASRQLHTNMLSCRHTLLHGDMRSAGRAPQAAPVPARGTW